MTSEHSWEHLPSRFTSQGYPLVKLNRLLASGLLALALTGCAALGINQTPTGTNALSTAEKALTIAEASQTAVGATLDALVKAGVLKGADAQNALNIYHQSGHALDAAETADKLGNAQDVTAAVLESQTLVNQVHAITDPAAVKAATQ